LWLNNEHRKHDKAQVIQVAARHGWWSFQFEQLEAAKAFFLQHELRSEDILQVNTENEITGLTAVFAARIIAGALFEITMAI
jgi:hypothetical protein